MPPSTPKKTSYPWLFQAASASPTRDITWDRPLFRPPVLANPRTIFDPLPFTTQRVTAGRRQASGT